MSPMSMPNHPSFPDEAFSDSIWGEVIDAMDRTYSELVSYQEKLELQNTELGSLRPFMSSVFRSVSDVLIVIDRAHRIEQIGGSFDVVFGVPQSTHVGVPFEDLATEVSQPVIRAALNQVIQTQDFATVEIDVTADTGMAPLELSIAPRLNERGKSMGAVIIGRPMGELRKAYSQLESSHQALKEAQAHLARNEKLASLGRLVTGVAHELNNPISFVYANTHALEKYATRLETCFDAVQSGAPREDLLALRKDLRLDRDLKNLRTAINGAKDDAERARDIVEDLRRLSTEGASEAVDFDLVHTAKTAADWVVKGTKTPVKVVFSEGVRPIAREIPDMCNRSS